MNERNSRSNSRKSSRIRSRSSSANRRAQAYTDHFLENTNKPSAISVRLAGKGVLEEC